VGDEIRLAPDNPLQRTALYAETMTRLLRYSINITLERVDWNAELLRGDLGKAVRALKREPWKGLYVGGVALPLALAELGNTACSRRRPA
jgi:hypothetical protein